jgi:DNA-binding winged helix-turn-helix (wHTH) protein
MKPNDPPRRLSFGPYEADFHTQELRKFGTRLKISGQPLQILEMLLVRPGQLVAREELQKVLWPGDVFVDSNHGLNAAVNKLREALCDSADDPKYIETLPRRGYRFIGVVDAPAAEVPSNEVPCRMPEAAVTAFLPSAQPTMPPPNVLAKTVPAKTGYAAMPPRTALGLWTGLSRPGRWVTSAAASTALLICGIGVIAIANKTSTNTERALRIELARAESNQKNDGLAIAEPLSPNAGNGSPARERNEKEKIEAESLERRKKGSPADIGSVPDALADAALGAKTREAVLRETIPPNSTATLFSPPQPVPNQPSPTLRTVVYGNSGNAAPQFSPDGKQIAFMSNRSGAWQIWLSDVDGSRPRQVSFTESAGTPRWSPDGSKIAFDAPSDGETRIFVMPVHPYEQARPLVQGLVPSFSRDGKWIYFGSERTGDWQVWKVPVIGGQEVQVTRHGGFAALESDDGFLYYAKSRYPQPEICRVPVKGGEEACGQMHLRPRTWASWAVTCNGIVFAEDLPNGKATLSIYDPKRREVRDLVPLRSAPFWVGASLDGNRAIMNDATEQQISMVENLQ